MDYHVISIGKTFLLSCKYNYIFNTRVSENKNTVMSLLEAPYLIEAPLSESAYCHGIVEPPQNRSAGRL